MWFEIAVMSLLFAVGHIFFGHWEIMTPKWKKLLKLVLFIGLTILITYLAGRTGFFIFLGIMFAIIIFIHAMWLPHHGINGWTGEPKEKYYKLRGWDIKSTTEDEKTV
jgi:hypothetical protein